MKAVSASTVVSVPLYGVGQGTLTQQLARQITRVIKNARSSEIAIYNLEINCSFILSKIRCLPLPYSSVLLYHRRKGLVLTVTGLEIALEEDSRI